jgi:uncharacterized protein (TIGR02646 family)
MLPILRKNEPDEFHELVRAPGHLFLAEKPHPRVAEWKGKEYWQKSLPQMRAAYNSICAYCACWIPYSTGSQSVDHFISKKTRPDLAYEWSNYRYSSTRFNSRKGTKTILDPFTLPAEWFVIDFTTLFIKPNSGTLTAAQKQQVENTIEILHLNDDDELVRERQEYYHCYLTGEILYSYLVEKAPFIGYEIHRQGMII